MRRAGLPTLPDAVTWLRDTWTPREWPQRLHTRDHDGWGLRFAPAFAAHLDATPDDTGHVTETRTCRHPRLSRDTSEWECPDCAGSGTFETTTLVYRSPMWRALTRLQRRHRAAHDLVVLLVINGYSTADVATLGFGEGVQLRAIRRLFACYQRAPEPRVRHTEKSEAQIAAEAA